MGATTVTTVLFAQVSGHAELMRSIGQLAGQTEVSNCLERLRRAGVFSGGRAVRVTASNVMMVFDTPDSAATAAARMHEAAKAFPAADGTRLGVRVGFETGPVLVSGRDVLGDTVKLAAKLLRDAQRGQTLTSERTAGLLSRTSRAFCQRLPAAGREPERSALPEAPRVGAYLPRAVASLRLVYGTQRRSCPREGGDVVIGRDPACGLLVDDELVSRRHCTIRLAPGGFVIRDHSSNGTYLMNEGEEELLLWEDEATLAVHGWVSFGQPRLLRGPLLEFFGT